MATNTIKFKGIVLMINRELCMMRLLWQTVQMDDGEIKTIEKPTILSCFWNQEILDYGNYSDAQSGYEVTVTVNVKNSVSIISSIDCRPLCRPSEITSVSICAKELVAASLKA